MSIHGVRTSWTSSYDQPSTVACGIGVTSRKRVLPHDIKLANILALTLTHWLIGDFGNIRKVHHPYYSTRVWTKANQWHDCQANDVRRALKTYMAVLHGASSDPDASDDEFYLKRQAWSRLYWRFVRQLMHAEKQLERQRNESLEMTALVVWISGQHLDWPKNLLHIAITRELTCTLLKQSWREWWRMGGLSTRFSPETNPMHPQT